jgi:hypothetical protein
MAATALTDRYAANLHGVLSCDDRIIVTGTLSGACYAGGMTSFLFSCGIRIFDYPRFAEPLRDRIRERAQPVCEAAGVEIEHVSKRHIRKEKLVARVLAERLKRLHTLGLIKKVTHTSRYYLTRVGRAAIAAACSLTRFNIVPAMAATH